MTAVAAKSVADLERDEAILEFLLCKELDYRKRSKITKGLAAAGLLAQIVFLSVYPGIPFLLAALLMSWVVGFDNRVDRGRYRRGATWESARFEQMTEILALDKRMRKWDASALDVTSPAGCAFWLLALVGIGFATLIMWQWSADVALIFAVDAGLLLLFQWLNGMRTVQRQPGLLLKVRHLAATANAVRGDIPHDGELGAQLLMRGGEDGAGGVPEGAKIAVTWPDGPEYFYGVQGQVVLNNVQGKKHPYFYSVLVARQGHGLLEATRSIDLPSDVIKETQKKAGVDVVIIRQHTTKTSGYSTSVGRSQDILSAAVRAAARFVASAPARAAP